MISLLIPLSATASDIRGIKFDGHRRIPPLGAEEARHKASYCQWADRAASGIADSPLFVDLICEQPPSKKRLKMIIKFLFPTNDWTLHLTNDGGLGFVSESYDSYQVCYTEPRLSYKHQFEGHNCGYQCEGGWRCQWWYLQIIYIFTDWSIILFLEANLKFC